MGPYAPVVSYPTISTLSLPAPTPSLETAASLPSTPPFLTTWTESLSVTGYNVQWPTYWPGTVSGATENLVCSGSFTPTPQINFVASLASSEDLSSCLNPTMSARAIQSSSCLPRPRVHRRDGAANAGHDCRLGLLAT